MDKKIAGLLGGVAALTTLGAAQAATPSDVNATNAVRASSYADLLTPVPNAMAAWRSWSWWIIITTTITTTIGATVTTIITTTITTIAALASPSVSATRDFSARSRLARLSLGRA
jgi:hypothetical protein